MIYQYTPQNPRVNYVRIQKYHDLNIQHGYCTKLMTCLRLSDICLPDTS